MVMEDLGTAIGTTIKTEMASQIQMAPIKIEQEGISRMIQILRCQETDLNPH